MRHVQLDSLRGLAACTVVCCHATNLLPAVYNNPDQAWWLTKTPLALLISGHAAVIFFFILSGYVLALPFLKGSVSYSAFILRRICRIWIPYIVAMAAAICCAVWFHPSPVAGLSSWANRPLSVPDLGLALNHLLLVGKFANGTYDPVVWSLVYEMRISLVFPFLVLLLQIKNWWRVLAIAVAMSVAAFTAGYWPIWESSQDLPMTLHYAGLFVVGMILAREMPRLQALYNRFSIRTKAALWMLAVACYTHDAWLLPHSKLQEIPLYRDGLIAIAVSFFIVSALSASRFSAWLESKPLTFLGNISYSVYLYHAIILLSLVHMFYGAVPLGVLWIATCLLTLGVATLSYRLVEIPAIRLGKQFRLEQQVSETQVVRPAVG